MSQSGWLTVQRRETQVGELGWGDSEETRSPRVGMEHTQCLASWNEKAFVDLQVYDDCVTLLSIGGFSRCCFNVEIVRLFSAGMTLRLLLRTQPAASMLSQQVELRGESPFSSRMASQVSQCSKSSE